MTQSLWICPFKAHTGKPVEDIPRSYLEWLLEQNWFCDPSNDNAAAIKAIETELAYRARHGEPGNYGVSADMSVKHRRDDEDDEDDDEVDEDDDEVDDSRWNRAAGRRR